MTESTDPQTFTDFLAEHADGSLNDELTADLKDLVQTVGAIGKKGTLTLVVTVDRSGGSGRMVRIAAEHKVKLPKVAPDEGLFYVGNEGGLALHRNDPFQPKLPMAEAPAAPAGLVVPPPGVDPATGEITDPDA